MPKPLAGLRVLELARILAGPWAGQVLADLGADVIKVERKGTGDDTRGWGPPFIEGADGNHIGSAYFHAANRGKRSIEMDFESDEGRRIVRKLAARSDVLIENFKVGGLAKFGLDYKSLAPECPRLIYCSVTGFGQDGPYAKRAGYDLMAQGMGGIMDLTGMADGEPTRIGIPVSDIFTGVYSVIGILAALTERYEADPAHFVSLPRQIVDSSSARAVIADLRNEGYVEEQERGSDSRRHGGTSRLAARLPRGTPGVGAKGRNDAAAAGRSPPAEAPPPRGRRRSAGPGNGRGPQGGPLRV